MGHGGSRYGAGRRRQWATAEHCKSIDVRHFRRIGALEPGDAGTVYWPDMEGVAISADGDSVKVHPIRPGATLQRIPILWTPCNFGGERPWFGCPACSRRVSVLYLRDDGFACRTCAGLCYRSQREDEMARAWRKQRRIEARLGGRYARPRGMHEATWAKLLSQIDQCEGRRLRALHALALTLPSLKRRY